LSYARITSMVVPIGSGEAFLSTLGRVLAPSFGR